MTYWSWWVSGIALSGVMLFHWFALHRMMAVSGRVSGLVDRLRHGAQEPDGEMSAEEMMAAIQAETAAEFGAEDAFSDSPASGEIEVAALGQNATRSSSEHLVFLGSLVLGGALATLLAGGFHPTLGLRSEDFNQLGGGNVVLRTLLLVGGGACVGFGTRMAGGCTSGHGLCGTSRLQPGSLLTTVSFFVTGIVVSFALGYFL